MVYKGKNFSNAFSNVTNTRREEDKRKVSELELKNKELINVLNMEKNNITEINLSEIILKENIRESDYNIEDLAKNIKINSQLVPVLVTKDFILIDGYRRYYSLKNNDYKEIKVSFLEKTYNEIKNIFPELQYYSNQERQNLDNLDLSFFYSKYQEKGLTILEIANKFNKSKGYISKLISLKNIDQSLQGLIREFQTYSYSKEKFHALNLSSIDKNKSEKTKTDDFYLKNKGVFIGISTLYRIAKEENKDFQQQQIFYSIFKNRLSEEENKTFLELFENSKKDKTNNNKDNRNNNNQDNIDSKDVNNLIDNKKGKIKIVHSFLKDIKSQVKSLFTEEKQKLINEKLKELEQLMK